MIDWCAESDLPLHILLTKADKLKRGPQQSAVLGLRKKLTGANTTVQAFSATKKLGLEELEKQISAWLE